MSGPIFTAYGFTQPLIDVPQPIVAQRDPTVNDRSFIGNIWVNRDTNSVFVLTAILGPVFTWTSIGGGGDVAIFNTDAGLVTPVLGVVNVLGGLNINTSGAGNTLTVNLDNTVSITGSFTAGTSSGDISVDHGNINLPNTDPSGIEGIINFGGLPFIHNSGTTSTYIGGVAGDLNNTGIDNLGAGNSALGAITSGQQNCALGSASLTLLTDGNANCAAGYSSGSSLTSGNNNVLLGYRCASDLLDGEDNIIIGSESGSAYSGSESSNIVIGSSGDPSDANTIRIGSQGTGAGQQDTCFVAGIVGNTVGNTEFVTIDTLTGQLGTTPTPSGAFMWQTVTTATPLVPNNGYIVNGGSTVVFTLPVTAAVGDTMKIRVLNTAVGSWEVDQNASQYIIANGALIGPAVVSTTGVAGSIAADAPGSGYLDAELICVIANTAFTVNNGSFISFF